MLWLTVIQAITLCLLTHLLAKRKYALRWNDIYVKRVIAFGWPLLINGLLMFAVFEGDRIVIGAADRIFGGSRYSMADLGVYFIALTLTTIPIAIPAKTGGMVFLPALARVQQQLDQFSLRYSAVVQLYAVVGAVLAMPLITVGGWLASIIYGPQYGAAGLIIAWLAGMQGIRLLRASITLAAISRGDTKLSLFGTIVRITGLLGVLVIAAAGESLAWIAAAGCVSEIITVGVCIYLLRRRHSVPMHIGIEALAISALAMAAAGIATYTLQPRPALAFAMAGCAIVIVISIMFARASEFRCESLRVLDAIRNGLQRQICRQATAET
jgi:O-antigen/teichoic acid export membrane protein